MIAVFAVGIWQETRMRPCTHHIEWKSQPSRQMYLETPGVVLVHAIRKFFLVQLCSAALQTCSTLYQKRSGLDLYLVPRFLESLDLQFRWATVNVEELQVCHMEWIVR